MGPLFIPAAPRSHLRSAAGTRRHRSARRRALGRLLAVTVRLISFHDLINHSISARRRISVALKASDRHKRDARRTDLRVLDKQGYYMLITPPPPPPRTTTTISPAPLSDPVNPVSLGNRSCTGWSRAIGKVLFFNGSFFLQRCYKEAFPARFHRRLLSFHGSAGILKALLITFSYDLDLKGQGNQYNSH